MAIRRISVKSVSFGPQGGSGLEHVIAEATVEINLVEDSAETGIAVIEEKATSSEVTIDQMVSEFESAILRVDFKSRLRGEALNAAEAMRVAVQIVDTDNHVIVFPRCLHGVSVEPPTVRFTAQDIDEDGKTYWAIVDGKKIYGNKKVNLPEPS